VYRTIPVRYTRAGFDYALRLDDIRVFDDSVRPLRTEIAREGRYVRIKAWVPGAVNATKTVIVTYRVRRGLFDVDDHAELYWNVTGNEWEVPIREAEALVVSPAGVPLDAVRSVAYTGYAGTAGADYAEERADHFITFRTTRPLRPREGLTVAVAWPPAALSKAGRWREAAWFLGDNWPLGLPALALALALLVWGSYGRDPAVNRSVKPEYAPPEGLMPAEAGALVGERAHPSDVSATLVDLAVRGYLRVEQLPGTGRDPDFLFRRLRPIAGDGSIRPFESFLLTRIFGSDGSLATRELSAMRRDYDNVFPPIRDELYQTLVRDGLFPVSPARIRAGWIGAGVAALAAGGAVFIWSSDAGARVRAERGRAGGVRAAHAAQDLARRPNARGSAGLPGVPRASREGPPGADARGHAAPLAAMGHRAGSGRALDLQLRGAQGGRAHLAQRRGFLFPVELPPRGDGLQPGHRAGDHDRTPRGGRGRLERRQRLLQRLLGRRHGRGRGRHLLTGARIGASPLRSPPPPASVPRRLRWTKPPCF
jgi:hypothetical protein